MYLLLLYVETKPMVNPTDKEGCTKTKKHEISCMKKTIRENCIRYRTDCKHQNWSGKCLEEETTCDEYEFFYDYGDCTDPCFNYSEGILTSSIFNCYHEFLNLFNSAFISRRFTFPEKSNNSKSPSNYRIECMKKTRDGEWCKSYGRVCTEYGTVQENVRTIKKCIKAETRCLEYIPRFVYEECIEKCV